MRSLFIDSGQNTGWALFTDAYGGPEYCQRLESCGLGEPPLTEPHSPTLVVFELPVALRTGGRGKVNANSLILTAARGGYAAGRGAPRADVIYVTPEQWKGQLPKEVTMLRGVEALTIPEKGLIIDSLQEVAKSLHNNVWDAIAMGLVWHGRIRGMRIRGSKPLFGGGK